MAEAARALQGLDVAALDRSVAALSSAMAAILREIPEVDERGVWQADGATSMTAWLAARYRITKVAAREWVRAAHALRDLPHVERAFAEGRLSWDQVKFLAHFVTPETDELWAQKARDRSPFDLWVEARRHERIRDREAADLHSRRNLRLVKDPEKPVVYLAGMLAGEQGEIVEKALYARAQKMPADPAAAYPSEARIADAFVDLVSQSGSGNNRSSRSKPVVVVHADAAVLSDEEPKSGPSICEAESGQRLAAETVRRLACDANVDIVAERDGVPVGIGRRGRIVPPHVERALRLRDRTCRFPGCEGRLWIDAHHIVHWGRGGRTDLDNLVLLCDAHHRLVHDGGWRIAGKPGQLEFYNERGRRLRTPPPELPFARSGFP